MVNIITGFKFIVNTKKRQNIAVFRILLTSKQNEWYNGKSMQFNISKMRESIMYLIVGLGNPGAKYANTRHNIGFDIVDILAAAQSSGANMPKKGVLSRISGRKSSGSFKLKSRALICDVKIAGEKAVLAKPQTFMNLSGESVAVLAKFYKIETGNIIVIYDDVDLPLGKIRLRPGGGAGGHNGIKSIISHLGEDFCRVRIGIGASRHDDFDTADYVLGKFTKTETNALAPTLNTAIDAVEEIVKNGIQSAMNKFN